MTGSERLRLVWILLGTAGAAAAAGAASAALDELRPQAVELPSTRVTRGQLPQVVILKGELRTTQSAVLLAPPVSGSMRILTLVPTGAPIKSGDLVVSFDTSDQQYQLAQARSQLREADLEIRKLKADNAVQAAKDKVDLLTARFDVRRAELDTRGNDLVGRVQARKNELTLEEARRKLTQLEQDVQERTATSRAALEVVQEKRNKALITIEQADRNISQMEIRALFDGVVSVRENRDAAGGFFFPGMTLPEYAEGDMAAPGRPIAEVLDATKLEILAKAPEASGATIAAGQSADVTVFGLPGRTYRARVKTVGAVASRGGRWGDNPARQFDVTLQLEGHHADLRPGQTLRVAIQGQHLQGVLHVPRQAVFGRRGASVIYIRSGSSFEARDVKVVRRTESRAVIEGVAEGTEVALVDPEEGSASAGLPARTSPTAVVGAR